VIFAVFAIKNTLRTFVFGGLLHRKTYTRFPPKRLLYVYGRSPDLDNALRWSAFPKGGVISSLPHGSGGCGGLAPLFSIISVRTRSTCKRRDYSTKGAGKQGFLTQKRVEYLLVVVAKLLLVVLRACSF
jgi:hypothetical protein